MAEDWELLSVEGRFKTFKKFPKIKGAPLCNPENFAVAGFYQFTSKGNRDLVKCFACKKQLGNWEEGDDPWAEHVKRGQNCPFVKMRQEGSNEVTLNQLITLYSELKKHNLKLNLEEKKAELTEVIAKLLG